MADNRDGAGKRPKGSTTVLESAREAASKLARQTTDGAQAAWNAESTKKARSQASKTASSWVETATKASKGMASGFFAGLSQSKPPEQPSMLQRMRGEPAAEQGWHSTGRQAGKAVRESAVAAAESATEAATAGTVSYLRTIRNWTIGIFLLGCFAYGVGSAVPNALRGMAKDRLQRRRDGSDDEGGPSLGDWARGAWSSMSSGAQKLREGAADSDRLGSARTAVGDRLEGARTAVGDRVSRWKESVPSAGKEAWSKLRSKLPGSDAAGTDSAADTGAGAWGGWFGAGRDNDDK